MIRKELLLHWIAYNLVRAVMLQAALCYQLALRQLSFKGTLDALQAFAAILQGGGLSANKPPSKASCCGWLPPIRYARAPVGSNPGPKNAGPKLPTADQTPTQIRPDSTPQPSQSALNLAPLGPVPVSVFNPPRAWRLTRKVQGKTVTLALSAAQADAFRQAIANHRRLDELLHEMRQLSVIALLGSAPGVKKRPRPTRPKPPLT